MKIFAAFLTAVAFAGHAAAQSAPALAERVRAELLFSWRAYERYAWGHDELRPVSKTPREWHRQAHLGQELRDHPPRPRRAPLRLRAHRRQEAPRARRRPRHAPPPGLQLPHRDAVCKRQFTNRQDKWHEVESRRGGDAAARIRDAIEADAQAGLLRQGQERARAALQAALEDRPRRRRDRRRDRSRASHVGGGIDSYYEYLLKCARLFGDKDCESMWRTSIKAVNTYLADGDWYGEVDMETGKRTAPEFGALHAFFPGVLALGGDIARAKALEASAFRMWQLHGIEPEVINYKTMTVVYPGYPLRPEIVESAYVLRRLTHEKQYVDMGKVFLDSLVAPCRTDAGYTNLKSVVTMEKGDLMPSYFLAETLKYLYLIFAPDSVYDFKRNIFTTEAHPLRR